MNKKVICIFILLFCLILTSCSTPSNSNNTENETISNETKASDSVSSESYSTEYLGERCEVDGCTKIGSYDIVGFSGETEYYCYTHYNEIEDIIDSMIDDVSENVCEVDGCTKAGYYEIVGFSGLTEYYCYEHYKELEEMLGMLLS